MKLLNHSYIRLHCVFDCPKFESIFNLEKAEKNKPQRTNIMGVRNFF